MGMGSTSPLSCFFVRLYLADMRNRLPYYLGHLATGIPASTEGMHLTQPAQHIRAGVFRHLISLALDRQ